MAGEQMDKYALVICRDGEEMIVKLDEETRMYHFFTFAATGTGIEITKALNGEQS